MAAESDGEPPDHIRQQIESIVDERLSDRWRERAKQVGRRLAHTPLTKRQVIAYSGWIVGSSATGVALAAWQTEKARAAATGEVGTAADPLLKQYVAELLGGGVPIKVSDHLDLQSSQEHPKVSHAC